jgi:hypothetical protein
MAAVTPVLEDQNETEKQVLGLDAAMLISPPSETIL